MFENLSLLTALVSASGVLVSFWIFQRYKALRYLQSFGIACKDDAHFIYGNLHQLRWSKFKNIQEIQTEWLNKHGNIVGYYMGLKPRILVADLDILKQILIKEINIFTNRPDVPRGMPTLVSLRDQRWKEIRHILTPTYSLLKLKGMSPIISECAELLTTILKEKSSIDVDIYEYYQGLTLDVISRCALALQLDCQQNPQDQVLGAVRKFFKLDMSRIIVMLVCFPGLRTAFRLLFRFAPSHKLLAFVLNHVRIVMEHRRKEKEDPVLIDALHLLLEASEGKHLDENHSESPTKVLLTDDEIAWNACVFLLAGYETTSTALAYVTHCLCLHPDIQDRVYQEIVDKIGTDEDIALTYENVSQLEYLELVIHESLRLYPPVPLFVSRECKQTTTINGLTIPEDSVIDVPVFHIHRDPELWPDPNTFDPLRHLPEEKSKRHPLAYLPFGIGPRNCIGSRFAMLEMKITLAQLIRQYKINPSQKTRDPLPTVIRTTIMNPIEGVWIKIESR